MNKKIAIACQGGGSHSAFAAGVLKALFERNIQRHYTIIGLSGTSGGAISALLAWYGLLRASRGDPTEVGRRLTAFWFDTAAFWPWEYALNAGTMTTLRLMDSGFLPEVQLSPYAAQRRLFESLLRIVNPRPEFTDFSTLLTRHIDFEALPKLIGANSPQLFLGAVDMSAGKFTTFNSHKGEICTETVLAASAMPEMFRSISFNGSNYWDGLFAQNPPIDVFFSHVMDVEDKPDEIWIIRTLPDERPNTPHTLSEIADRRSELAGILALNQEIEQINRINRWIDKDFLSINENGRPRMKYVQVRQLTMSSQLSACLDTPSKLDRSRNLIETLVADGERQALNFLEESSNGR